MSSNNVVDFPVPYDGPPRNENELAFNLEIMKDSYIQEVADFVGSLIFHQLEMGGFDISDECFAQDVTLLHEALKSLMAKSYGISHPLQKLAEAVVNKGNRLVIVRVDENGKETETTVDNGV